MARRIMENPKRTTRTGKLSATSGTKMKKTKTPLTQSLANTSAKAFATQASGTPRLGQAVSGTPKKTAKMKKTATPRVATQPTQGMRKTKSKKKTY